MSEVLNLQCSSVYDVLIFCCIFSGILLIMHFILGFLEMKEGAREQDDVYVNGDAGRVNEDSKQIVNLRTLADKLSLEVVPYSKYRRETRLDSIFGFTSFDSEYADNFSSLDGSADDETNDMTALPESRD